MASPSVFPMKWRSLRHAAIIITQWITATRRVAIMPPPAPLFATSNQIALLFIELAAAIVGLALLARFASRWGFSSIPLFLLAGLAFGNGVFLPLNFSEDFIHI